MLVEYENSDSEPEDAEQPAASTAEPKPNQPEQDADENEAAEAPLISDDENDAPADANDDSADSQPGKDDELAEMAAADDTVEESLRMRVPASAQAPSTSAPPKAAETAESAAQQRQQRQKQQQLLLQQKRRRMLMLDPAVASNGADDDDEDDDDEDAAKRRRIASVAAAGQMRGATSLLARLPKPKALAIREGAARVLVPSKPASVPMRPPQVPPSASLASTSAEEAAEVAYPIESESELGQQQQLLGAVLPPSELHRYRQATGASLTADGGSGGIIDIRQDDQVAGADIELTKELTRNADANPRRRPDGPEPTSLAKRKHQITYLAYQAKERELELKNSWSDARFSQRSSQKKYGF